MARRLEIAEGSLASAEGREVQIAQELGRAQEDLVIKAEENQILQERYVSVLRKQPRGWFNLSYYCCIVR